MVQRWSVHDLKFEGFFRSSRLTWASHARRKKELEKYDKLSNQLEGGGVWKWKPSASGKKRLEDSSS